MTRYRISIERDALRSLAKLDKPVRRRVQAAIDRLADNPRPQGVRAMVDRPGLLRMRIGHYRVVYEVRDDELLVLVIDLAIAVRSTDEDRSRRGTHHGQRRHGPSGTAAHRVR